ncbi:MAG: hypothetical protein ACK4RK_12975 [Gemmataceae bacterium]
MNKVYCWLLISTVSATLFAVLFFHWNATSAKTTSTPVSSSPPVQHFSPALHLRITAVSVQAKSDELLDPDHVVWQETSGTAMLLSRTPRIYQTEPFQNRPVPACEVRALRSQDKLYFRLRWDDATKNAPTPPPARGGEGGDPKLLYKRPTGATALFADAAAIMAPENWIGPHFPSLLMGDQQSPVRLYYWNASRDAEVLRSSGRATPRPIGQSVPFQARHHDTHWVLALEITDVPDGYPFAVALWDGQFQDRDGLKFYSIWYVLTGN